MLKSVSYWLAKNTLKMNITTLNDSLLSRIYKGNDS